MFPSPAFRVAVEVVGRNEPPQRLRDVVWLYSDVYSQLIRPEADCHGLYKGFGEAMRAECAAWDPSEDVCAFYALFKRRAHVLRNVFGYLDRFHVPRYQLPSLVQVAETAFRTHVWPRARGDFELRTRAGAHGDWAATEAGLKAVRFREAMGEPVTDERLAVERRRRELCMLATLCTLWQKRVPYDVACCITRLVEL
jgi:hypothetical protein